MQSREEKTRFCPFCGSKIEYETITEDGSDLLGHQIGSYKTCNTDNTCTCEKIPFKKMCLNCTFRSGNVCTSETVVHSVKEIVSKNSPFKIENFLFEIKDFTKKCKDWKISNELCEKYFK